MNQRAQDSMRSTLEGRSRELFQESVDGVDMRVRSRLTQARHAALDAAAASIRLPWFLQRKVLTPAAGVTAAVMLAAALWLGAPFQHAGMTVADQPSLEDLDIVAASDESSGDAMEMLQNDLDFYDFADKAANPGPAA